VTEVEIKEAFEREKPALQRWGDTVCAEIVSAIQKAIAPRTTEDFLKIPPRPRVKDSESFLSKALRRRKNYSDPVRDITDKVGVRFVVLLRSELSVIEDIVENCRLWDAEKAKDFETERVERPHHFDYQSVHYIARVNLQTAHRMDLPPDLPCEVQVRTLLQHAYAELAHDRTYKPGGDIDSDTIRHVAKTAALVETADDIFVAVNGTLEAATAEVRRADSACRIVYQAQVQTGGDDARVSNAILDAYRNTLSEITNDSLNGFLNEQDFVIDRIRQRAPISALFRQPCVLAVYFLVQHHPDFVPQKWPFDLGHLEVFYSDLGISTEGRLS
jgi:ppGpp synthetase/RelA/SpoT-type nucleotidyltranferase